MLVLIALSQALAAPAVPNDPAATLVAHVEERAREMKAAGQPLTLEALLAPLVTLRADDEEDEEVVAWAEQVNPTGRQAVWKTFAAPLDGGVWQGYTLQGTLHCQNDWFFTVGSAGKPSLILSPPSYGSMCWSGGRSPGRAFGEPALVQTYESTPTLTRATVTVTPWTGGEWASPYQIDLRFDDEFSLTERFCKKGAECKGLATTAQKLARDFAHKEAGFAATDETRDEAIDSAFGAGRVSSADHLHELPTFGAKAQTDWPTFSGFDLIAVNPSGEPLIAQVGIGGLGWRELGDLMVVFSRADGATFVPFASYVIRRDTAGLASAQATTPEICEGDTC